MSKSTDLHLYLDTCPPETTFFALLDLYGFTFNKTVEKTKTEPHTTYFSWKLPEISGAGFQLLFFNTLFSDDLNRGFYESFIILSGYQHSSTADLNMIDVMAVLILNRYGGKLHNPQRIEKISTNYLLSGEVYSPFLIKNP